MLQHDIMTEIMYKGASIMRKILVTGGTVFVSRFVADYFARKGDDAVMRRPYMEYINTNI